VDSFLVFGKRAFAVESSTAMLDTAEECHLLCGTIQGTVHLALVANQIAFVLKAATTLSVLTHMRRNVLTLFSFNGRFR